ncbi:MAG: TIGR00296 family protein [Nitrososphaerota archaeon]|nr:TIGR00296 family protein [Nitrososphaerota archaeon]
MFDLTDDEGRFLVNLVRDTVKTFIDKGQTLGPPKDTKQKFYEKCGVFVTIHMINKNGKKLRGCIGYPYPSSSLIEDAIDVAINAATKDPRFPPMKVNEINKCVFEVSVLTPIELIQVNNPKEYVKQIKLGQDGLIVEKGYSRGLLLPQVPVELEWGKEEFLSQCCIKAGLTPNSWLTKDIKIYKFNAIIFEEQTPNGRIERLNL